MSKYLLFHNLFPTPFKEMTQYLNDHKWMKMAMSRQFPAVRFALLAQETKFEDNFYADLAKAIHLVCGEFCGPMAGGYRRPAPRPYA